jgi:queuine tRNA-ribosyltransferase subunit QTRTD1
MAKSTPGQASAEMFTIIKSTTANLSPRLARLSLPGRDVIETPHYLGLTSRGVIAHLSQDNFAQQTAISGVYAALEDCRFPATRPPLSRQRADKSTYTAV